MNSQNISSINKFQFQKPVFAFLIILVFVLTFFAQGSTVDLTFNAAASTDISNSAGVDAKVALQADGKILVFGSPFNNVSGTPKNIMARLNTDGTLDNSFTCACSSFGTVQSVVVQPDGKIVIAGTYGPYPYRRLARLNSDGSLDNSFVSPYGTLSLGNVNVWAVQTDGKILISDHYSSFHISATSLRRLNADGSFDSSFNSLGFDGWNSKEFLTALEILPGGKMMVSGKHSFGYIFRINPDGTKDTSFESPAMTSSFPQAPPIVNSFGIQSTGKVVIVGSWVTINGLNQSNFARLNPDGSVDTTFTRSLFANKLKILSGDKILVEGSLRLNPDGTDDNSFAPAYLPTAWVVDSLERIVFIGPVAEGGLTSKKVGRMNTDGSSDGSFNFASLGFTGDVLALAVQSDGKVLLSGYFNRVNGIVQRGLARVNSNGSLDNTFNAGTGFNNNDGLVNVILVQPDGKILIGGYFMNYNGTAKDGIVRLNSDGSLDATFNPVFSANPTIYAIALQPDGKILIGGTFSTVNGSLRSSFARLNSDGSLDAAFNPVLGGATIYSVFVQSDGRILVGGAFSGVNGFNRSNLARLNSDGTLDAAFNAGNIGAITQIAQQPDGKYLVLNYGSVLRRNNDGTADGSFAATTSETGSIRQFARQSDGNIIVVGSFTDLNNTQGRNYLARLRSDGVLDTSFFPVGPDRPVYAIAGQADGKYIIGGDFSTVQNIPRTGVARISPAVFQRGASFDFDGDGKADVSVFRPSENKWYVLRSSDLTVQQFVFAIAGDIPVPADYDGDGKTDFAIFRPSSGDWWSLSSQTGGQVYAHWGASGDIPRPSDFDGDGRTDYVVFRPSNFYWYRISSANGAASAQQFGAAGDKPVIGDFDGDGKSDKAIFRPSSGDWWYQSSINGAQLAVHWGISTDIPAPADFDGDGKTDFAVYRPSTGTWYIINSSNFSFTITNFGISEDKPVPADYDGDGKADIAVFRPSTGAWYLQRTTAGFWGLSFGISTDIPTENAFIQ